jgi:hypothetical protein
MSTEFASSRADRAWFIVTRWHEYEGEARANVLRILSIGAFYLVELFNYYGLHAGSIRLPPIASLQFHQRITAVAVVWTILALLILMVQQRRIFPSGLKFLSTGADLILLTTALMLGPGGGSTLTVGYFVLVALAALRFSLWLVRFAALGGMLAYLLLPGCMMGWIVRDTPLPKHHQLLFLVGLGATGVILGQVIRSVRQVAREYATQHETPAEEPR